MQVLTRSDGVPNNANSGETNNGILFIANANGNGALRISSWVNGVQQDLASTLFAMVPNSTYQFAVFDDGLNLSLTMKNLGSGATATVSSTSNLKFATNHVVFHNRESNNGAETLSYLDNVVISAVPEPGSIALLGLGGFSCLIFARAQRRRHRAGSTDKLIASQ